MRSQYHRLAQRPNSRLPKILGLTASPIWDYKSLQQAEKDIRTLQSALAAQLYDVKRKGSDVSKHNFKPNEITLYFEPSPQFKPFTLPPWGRIDKLIDMHGDSKLDMNFKLVYEALGIYAYKLSIVNWLQALLNLDNLKKNSTNLLLDPNHQKEIQRVIKEINQELLAEDIPQNQLSTKVHTLNQLLLDYKLKEEEREFQGILFVERRLHAQLLPTLLERNARLKGFIRPAALTGHGGNDPSAIGPSMDSKTQNNTVQKLRAGEFNLVVATSVAEEGLDFPACRIVIRFDEITTWKGYIQSRGRARARNSDYIVLLPTGCEQKYSTFVGKEEELQNMVYNRPEGELIDDGKLESTPQLICPLPDERYSLLTYSSALSLINDVCQLIPSDEFLSSPMPEFECQELGDNFVYKLTLPPMAALLPSERTFTGDPMPAKIEAKRSAAFEACKVLLELGVLNEHLLPHREDKVALALDANGRKIENATLPEHVEVIVPNAYGNLWTSTEIWFHKFSFRDANSSSSTTMGLLCGRRLFMPDSLRLYNHLIERQPLLINIETTQKLEWDRDVALANLKKMDTFTRVVIQASINRKGYEGELYFLVAPLLDDTCEIDWSLMENPLVPLSNMEDLSHYASIIAPLRALRSQIFDRFEPCHDLSGSCSPRLLPACPKMSKFFKTSSKFKSLAHFYNVVYGLNDTQHDLRSLVYLETNFSATNNLSEVDPLLPNASKILLPRSTCQGSHITRSDWNMYSYLPSLTRILHDGCQMVALFEKLNLTGIHTPLAIKALTPPGVGVPWDYQILETIGDAFLKLATSVHLYLTCLKKGEGDLSYLRSRSTDNDYLRQKAIQANLPGHILSQRFRVDRFRDAQTEDGEALESGDFLRKIPRRVLSDVVEALLGAGYLSGDVELGLKVGMALDLCLGGTSPWSQRPLSINFGTQDSHLFSESFKYQQIERKINYVFKRKLLLIQALTHRSANSFLTNCYEREEWLGDAVIDMWIIDHAHMKHFANFTPEKLTLARNKVVNNASLGFLAIRKLGLQKIINHKSTTFNEACREALEAIKPFDKTSDFFADVDNLFIIFDPPKILNDVLEAIIGAVFVDSGFNLQKTYQSLDLIFEDVLSMLPQLVAHDPLSRLLMLVNNFQCRELDRESFTITASNPDGDGKLQISSKVCRILFHGEEIAEGRHATSRSVAEQRASLEALKVLSNIESTESAVQNSLWSKCQCRFIAATSSDRTSPKVAELKLEN